MMGEDGVDWSWEMEIRKGRKCWTDIRSQWKDTGITIGFVSRMAVVPSEVANESLT